MDHYTQYFDYHLKLLRHFREQIQSLSPYQQLHSDTAVDISESDQAFIDQLDELCLSDHYTEALAGNGQSLVSKLVSGYGHLMPLFPRDLLWFFGGDCLHYMPDEEIQHYQRLDELRFAAEAQQRPFDIPAAKAFLMEQTEGVK